MSRKTVAVAKLLFEVNRRNRVSTSTKEERRGWSSLLESVLHDTGNYLGFSYLGCDDVPPTSLPGIRWEGTGQASFKDCDDSRRCYYVGSDLRKEYEDLQAKQNKN